MIYSNFGIDNIKDEHNDKWLEKLDENNWKFLAMKTAIFCDSFNEKRSNKITTYRKWFIYVMIDQEQINTKTKFPQYTNHRT